MAELAAAGAAASLSLADVDYNDVGKKEGSQLTLMGMVTLILAGGSATLWAASMGLFGGAVVVVAGCVSFVVAPIALVQRYSLSKMATFREVHNALRGEVKRFSEENDDLERQTDALSDKAERVKKTEAHLSDIASAQGSSVNNLVNLVAENGKIQAEMEDMIKSQMVEQIMNILVQADRDQDFYVDDNEIDIIILRVRSIRGIENLDETKVRKLLKSNRGMEGLFKLIRDMEKNNEMSLVQLSSRKLVAN
mmetsp:Transcript_17216/g.26095  ORF Transcript_17216/g.26095 Transcript_17216/m.26095 type:complete len:251 (-) Transcript_17216:1679-2431(-)